MALDDRHTQRGPVPRATVEAVARGVRPSVAAVSEESSEDLARRAQAGSSRAFEALYDRYERSLWRFLRVLSGSDVDADDLVQQTCLRAWRHLDRYRPAWAFSTWLFTIGRREALSLHRSRARRPGPLPDAERAVLEPRDASHTAVADEERHNLWVLAGRVLSPDQRSALWLHYVEGLSTPQIGAVLGKTDASVRVVLHRARRALARHLEDPS